MDSIQVYLTSTMTNESFAASICPRITNSIVTLSIRDLSKPSDYLVLPTCVRENSTSITGVYFVSSSLLLTNFSALPSSTKTLSLGPAKVAPLSSTASDLFDGFDGNSVAWEEVWSLLPNLTTFYYAGSLLGSNMPQRLPKQMAGFQASNTGLAGTISSSLLSLVTPTMGVLIQVPGNRLSGTIPADLLAPWANFTSINGLEFDFSGNQLSGSIPSNFFGPIATVGMNYIRMKFGDNRLTGAIPSVLFPSQLVTGTSTVTANFSFNALTGSIPYGYINLTSVQILLFDFSHNQLGGTLPAQLFPSSWEKWHGEGDSFIVSLNNNRITGTIPYAFITGGLSRNASVSHLEINLENNLLTGSIPSNFLSALVALKRDDASSGQLAGGLENKRDSMEKSFGQNLGDLESRDSSVTIPTIAIVWNATSELYLDFSSNSLSGTVPKSLISLAATTTGLLTVSVAIDNNNGISGSVPNNFFASVPDTTPNTSLVFTASNTSISILPDAGFCRQMTPVTLDLSYTKIGGAFPPTWISGCQFTALFLDNCPALTSSLPSTLFSLNAIRAFHGTNTPFSGVLPAVSPKLVDLQLANTSLDFCSSSTTSLGAYWTSGNVSCSLSYSLACGCASNFTQWCSVECTPCPPNTRPTGGNFECLNGMWTATTTVAPTLTIPSGAGTVVISGDLPSESIVIQGLGTTVQVSGCASNLTSITVQLSPQQVETLGTSSQSAQTLLTTGSSDCNTTLEQIEVNTNAKSGCKKVKVQKVLSNGGSTLSALFTLDKSGCNTWWIILVSVVCGVILLAVIALVLLAVFYKPFREKMRPYSKHRKHAAV